MVLVPVTVHGAAVATAMAGGAWGLMAAVWLPAPPGLIEERLCSSCQAGAYGCLKQASCKQIWVWHVGVLVLVQQPMWQMPVSLPFYLNGNLSF